MYDVVQVLVFGVVHETWWPIPLHRFGEITTHSGPTCHTIFIIFFLKQCQPRQPRRAEPTSRVAACCSERRPLLRPYRPRCTTACSVAPSTFPPLQSAAPATFSPSQIRGADHLPSLLQSVVGAAPVSARGNPALSREDLVPLCRIKGGGGADGQCSWREVVGGSGGMW
jgi:hypothetical protein